jgi:hypothetical protein
MGNLLNRLQQKFDHKLESTTKLENINEPLRSELEDLYGAKGKYSLNANLTASLINGIYTEKIQTFLFSVRLLQKLVASDPNLTRQTIGSDEFKAFKAYLISNKIMKVTSDATGFGTGQKENKAAKCVLIDSEIIDLLKKTKSKEVINDDSDTDDDYENNLEIPEIDSGLMKAIKDKVKARKIKPTATENKFLKDIEKQIRDINIERSTYNYTVGWNNVLDTLDKIKRLCVKEKYSEALDLINEMQKTREQVYKVNHRANAASSLKQDIAKCHKENS